MNGEKSKAKEGCARCAYSQRRDAKGDAEYVCRRNPPQLVVILSAHPITQQPMQQVLSTQPTVLPEGWCGQYVDAPPSLVAA